jgi:hypothetical protein
MHKKHIGQFNKGNLKGIKENICTSMRRNGKIRLHGGAAPLREINKLTPKRSIPNLQSYQTLKDRLDQQCRR